MVDGAEDQFSLSLKRRLLRKEVVAGVRPLAGPFRR